MSDKPDVESQIRICLHSILDDLAKMKNKYPELADFSRSQFQDDLGPKEGFEWCMGFTYERNYSHATGKLSDQRPKVGKDGCFLFVNFKNLDEPTQLKEQIAISSLNVKVFWTCHLSEDGSQELRKDFETIVRRHILKLGERDI